MEHSPIIADLLVSENSDEDHKFLAYLLWLTVNILVQAGWKLEKILDKNFEKPNN